MPPQGGTRNSFSKIKPVVKSFSFEFHDRLNASIFSVLFLDFNHAESEPPRLAAATTNLFFRPGFFHRLNLYKKVYIREFRKSKALCQTPFDKVLLLVKIFVFDLRVGFDRFDV